MIKMQVKGNFKRTNRFLERIKEIVNSGILDKYGQAGVNALASATPVNTGKTAASWGYEIVWHGSSATINWYNTNNNDGCNIAILLQYGHGTRQGGFVQGIDYINPAIRPIFDGIATEAWEEVLRA